LEADTGVDGTLTDILSAVSANYVTREDLSSDETAAVVRVNLGLRAAKQEQNMRLKLLNFAYSGLAFLAAAASGQAKEEDYNGLHQCYLSLFDCISHKRHKDSKTNQSSDMNLFDYYKAVFRK
jgi:hypothetical protein